MERTNKNAESYNCNIEFTKKIGLFRKKFYVTRESYCITKNNLITKLKYGYYSVIDTKLIETK
jgi:hypothetical protein